MGRTVLGAVVGVVVIILGVVLATLGAVAVTGLSMDSPPTAPYLALNLLGSFGAAFLGGYLAVRVASGRALAGWIVAGVLLVVSLPGLSTGAPEGQPWWYPPVLALLGLAGVALGTRTAGRRSAPPVG